MKRRLIDSVKRKTERERQVALAMDCLKKMGHWQTSIEAAARESKVSVTYLARTLRISRKLHPSVLKMFDRGQIDTRQADRLTRLPKAQQLNELPTIMPRKPLSQVVDISRLP
jgi:hypothetical protein